MSSSNIRRLRGDVYLLKMDDDFVNDSKYMDCMFEGGLFASVNVYLDEDLGERLRSPGILF